MTVLFQQLLPERQSGLNYRNYTLYPLLIEAIGGWQMVERAAELLRSLIETAPGTPDHPLLDKNLLLDLPHETIDRASFDQIAELAIKPLTESLDEAIFIRALQIGEVAFYAIAELGDQCLGTGPERYSPLLTKMEAFLKIACQTVQLVIQRVTPEGFKCFTAVTGNISAVESQNYCRVEAHLTNVSDELLSSLLFHHHPSVVAKVRAQATLFQRSEIVSHPTSVACQKQLQNFKRLHLAALRKILGFDSLDQSSVSYLRRFMLPINGAVHHPATMEFSPC